MRPLFVRFHRWFGLTAAAFLFTAGATGALISWDHELDALLNPSLYIARTAGPPLPTASIVARVEAADPRVQLVFMPLQAEPGRTLMASVRPRMDPVAGRPFQPGYNQVAVDPATGEIQGRREWGALSLDRENLMPFVYKLHHSLHLPERGGVDWGIWVMGAIAMAWVIDTLVALWIAFPNWRQWRRSFAFRWHAGGHKLTFDLHRSGAMWVYGLVLVLAVTSVAMNLEAQVVRPLVSVFSPLTPAPLAGRPRPAAPLPSAAHALPGVLAAARAEAASRGWRAPAGAILLSPQAGSWGVGFFEVGMGHGDFGLGNPWLYFDARTARLIGAQEPGRGSAGDIFMQSMFPLHSGRIIGVTGRVLVSLMGLAIAMLSVTGVLIWARKRRARAQAARTARRANRGGLFRNPMGIDAGFPLPSNQGGGPGHRPQAACFPPSAPDDPCLK